MSLDTFAVSLTLGFASGRSSRRQKVRFLAVIGLFHFLMIVGGWYMGENTSRLVEAYDHWIAFGLLVLIGFGMIKSGATPENEDSKPVELLSFRKTLLLGLALSIDALISGFSLGMVEVRLVDKSQFVNILIAAAIVGVCASTISAAAILIGKKGSKLLGPRAEIFGGIILILIGLKILLEHICSV